MNQFYEIFFISLHIFPLNIYNRVKWDDRKSSIDIPPVLGTCRYNKFKELKKGIYKNNIQLFI